MSLLKLAKFVSFAGFPARRSDVMRMCVKIVSEKLEVLRTVIRSLSVLVMDDKFHIGFYEMSDNFLHYKTMLWNVTHAITKWMIRNKDINISGAFSASAAPKGSIFQAWVSHMPIIQVGG